MRRGARRVNRCARAEDSCEHGGMRLVLVGFVAFLIGCSTIVNPNTDRLGTDPGTDGGACAAGMTLCGRNCVDLQTDEVNCGACGFGCTGGLPCNNGSCECGPGEPGCSGVGDPNACGPDGVRCAPDQLCYDASCVCRPGLIEVGGACVDLRSDPQNCGAAGTACPEVCSRRVCRGSCPTASSRDCANACVPDDDPRHCGGCNRACAANEVCVDGDCRGYQRAPCAMCPCTECRDFGTCCRFFEGAACVEGDECPGFG